MSSGKDIYEERPYINSIGISLYALLLLLLIAHYIKRRIVNKIRSSGLCLFFYLSMALFLTMRILWLVSDFYYILPYKTEDGTIVYSKTIGSRLHFIFNRVSSALYLIIYISISIAWYFAIFFYSIYNLTAFQANRHRISLISSLFIHTAISHVLIRSLRLSFG